MKIQSEVSVQGRAMAMKWPLILLTFALLMGCGRTSLQSQCESDFECATGWSCVEGVCAPDGFGDGEDLDVGGDQEDTDLNGDRCESDLDCGEGICSESDGDCRVDVCNPESGQCEEISCLPDCEEGFEVVRCECLPVACIEDQDCLGRICEEGTCRACVDDLECSSDGSLVCDAGLCVDGPECRGDDDCRSFEVCVNEFCEERPECTFDSDCGTEEQCIAGVCTFTPECESDNECSAQSECVGGNCQPRLCRGNSDCPEGQLCDAGDCIDPPPTVACMVVTEPQTIAPNERIPLEAFAFNDLGEGVAASFVWTSSEPTVAAVDGNELVGGGAVGTTTVTAVLGGGDSIECQGSPQFQNLGLVPGDEMRVRVVQMDTGGPLSGAEVHAGGVRAISDGQGIVTLPLPTAPFEISVFHDDYNYLTVQGVSARDLRLPLSPRSGTGPVAGFTGEFDMSGANTSGEIEVGLAGASLAGDLLDVNLERLLGDPFVTEFSIPGLGGADIPLPGGVTAHGQILSFQIDGKKRYYVQSASGARLGWGISGRLPFQDLLGIFSNPPEDVGGAIATFLPLFSRFDHGQQPMVLTALPRVQDVNDINNNGDTTELLPDYQNFPVEDLRPSVRQQLSTAVSISRLPVLNGEQAQAAVLVGGTILDGPGFIPLGINATSDESGDGQPEERVMYMAPQYGSAVGGRYALLAIAFAGGGDQGVGGDFSIVLWNGENLSPAISLGSFPDSSTGNLNQGLRRITVNATAGPVFRVRMVGSERSWDVWSMGPQGSAGAFTASIDLPAAPAGWTDIFAAGGPVLVDAIRTTVSIDDLVRASGVGLRRTGLVTTSFNRTSFR